MSEDSAAKDEVKVVDTKFAALKKLNQEYQYTDEDYGKKMHAYLYLKYIHLYIYGMKMALKKFIPEDRPTPIKPSGPEYEIVDDLIRMSTSWTNYKALDPATHSYHGKVLRVEDAEKFFKVDRDINLPDLPKTIIPYEKARKAVVKNPDRIILTECSCRTVLGDKGCEPKEVCMCIGEPWATFVMEHSTLIKRREITQEEALEIIREQHEMGHVQSAFFKDSQNDRLYGLCNCCNCCCTAILAQNYLNAGIFANSGYLREVDQEKCAQCGTCASVCIFEAARIEEGITVNGHDKCMGCGVCQDKCPNGAISMRRNDPAVSEPLDLDVLMPLYQGL
ncbi:MAG: 4Fe-4S binding protein [Coriobacteriales bacterium]|jgi:Pyruvate/2-oxoacid:ferredoxin oxidoreductase delta subunit|nr:4Fe-4S binding protein [Coriobacteriales bacterium]